MRDAFLQKKSHITVFYLVKRFFFTNFACYYVRKCAYIP